MQFLRPHEISGVVSDKTLCDNNKWGSSPTHGQLKIHTFTEVTKIWQALAHKASHALTLTKVNQRDGGG